MSVLAIVHERNAALGVFADPLERRGLRVEEWLPAREARPSRAVQAYDAVIALGGAMNADEEAKHPWLRREKDALGAAIASEVPVLGVCLGSQLLAEAAGSTPRRARRPEIGWLDVELSAEGREDPVLGALPERFEAFHWHSYEAPLPPGAIPLATSPVCLQAYRLGAAGWGIQFHAEVSERDAIDWAEHHSDDPDAVAAGLDPDELAGSIRERIGPWNELGRGLCDRFLDAAGLPR